MQPRWQWCMLGLGILSGCGAVMEGRPTPPPIVQVSPAPTQDVGATATALVLRSIPTLTPEGIYIVRPGDTLGKIADSYATTVDEIMAANNLSDPNVIEVGQRLRLPTGSTPPDLTATITP